MKRFHNLKFSILFDSLATFDYLQATKMLFQSFILISLFSLIICAHNKQEKDVKEKDTQQTSEYNPLGALVRYYNHGLIEIFRIIIIVYNFSDAVFYQWSFWSARI